MLNVPLIGQGDLPNCLPACVEMVLQYHQTNPGMGRIYRAIEATKFGTPFSNVTLLTQLGVLVEYAEAKDIQPIVQAIAAGYPVICAVQSGWLPYWDEDAPHAVVLVEVSSTQAVLNDPAFAESRRTIALDTFLLAWYEQENRFAILRPR